jgi:hypothetical protein
MQGCHVRDHHGFLTIYDNVLAVDESDGVEEQAASLTLAQEET